MSLWDLLKGNKKDVFQQYADNMQPLQQELPLIQVEGGMKAGNPDNLPTPKKLTLTERLFGGQATPTDNIDPNTMNVTISENPRRGGLLNDLMNGAKENFDNEFNINNLIETQTPDGRTKGFAYRLGEGLGTVARGLSGWAGDAWAAGYNGLDAGMNRQAIRTGDRIYRDELIRTMQNSLQNNPEFNTLSNAEQQAIYNQLLTNPDGTMRNYNTMTNAEKQKFDSDLRNAYANRLYQNQQEQLNNIADRINGIKGYITNNMYNNFVRAQQLRDNADYRNMMANLQMQNNQALQDFRKDQAEYQRQKDIADRQDRALTRAITARGQDLNYGLGMARLNADTQKANAKQSARQQDAISTLNQIGIIRNMVRRNPNATGLGKGMLTGDILNRFDSNPNNIETRTAIDALRTKIRHDLTGAQFSPKEAKEYEKFLPNVRDNAKIINAKLDALEKRYYSDFGVSLTGNSGGSKKIGKYTVRVKK